MPSETLVIWNPTAGQQEDPETVLHQLTQIPNVVVRQSSETHDARSLAMTAAGNGIQNVVAAGGDGTVHEVINGLMASSSAATLGILPLGTANDLCSTLSIPANLSEAIDVIRQGKSRDIDIVEVSTSRGPRYCVNIASGGNSDRVTETITDELKQRWGPMCYLRGAVEVLTDLESYPIRICMDGGDPEEIDVWSIIVANGRTCAGRLAVAPRANIEDGLLDVILIRDGTLVDLAQIATEFLISDYLKSDQVIYRQGKHFSLQTEVPMRFSIDGELIESQPSSFAVRSSALRVVVGDDYRPDSDCAG